MLPNTPLAFSGSPGPCSRSACLAPRAPRPSRLSGELGPAVKDAEGFTIIEILAVVTIMLILMAAAVPAFNSLRKAGDITQGASDVAGVLENAASYARATNTYVWVGLFEEPMTGLPSANPATSGTGQVVLSTVASSDGTQISATGGALGTSLIQVGKLVKVSNIHLGDVTSNSHLTAGTGATSASGTDWTSRPAVTGSNLISATSPAATAYTIFSYPINGSQYRFTKAVEFTPMGEVYIYPSSALTPWIEIGLQPTHGTALDTTTPNVVAIQVAGISGRVKIYRK